MSIIQDKASLEWLRIKEYCENRLAEMRADNDGDLADIETAQLRGQIKFCKEILELESDSEPVQVPNTEYLG